MLTHWILTNTHESTVIIKKNRKDKILGRKNVFKNDRIRKSWFYIFYRNFNDSDKDNPINKGKTTGEMLDKDMFTHFRVSLHRLFNYKGENISSK